MMQKVKLVRLEDQIPNDPSNRTLIKVTRFSNHASVIRDIMAILKTSFAGPWTTWKKVQKHHRDSMWQHFQGLYAWPEDTDVVVRSVREKCLKKRFPDTMRRAREESVELAHAANVNVSLDGDLTRLKPYCPNWIPKVHWEKMIDEVWSTPKWKGWSKSGKGNRKKNTMVLFPNIARVLFLFANIRLEW